MATGDNTAGISDLFSGGAKILVLISCVLGCTLTGCSESDETPETSHGKAVWHPDQRDGTYINPVLHADYSDPDVVRVGDHFYLTSSSFASSPALPVLRSSDLVNWTIIGHAMEEVPPAEHYATPRHGNGVWAPAIRYHDNRFVLYYGDPDFGIYRVSAEFPEGPWSEPLLVHSAKGWIDPCPFWDDDGNAYLVHAWAKSRAGFNSVLTLRRMNAEGTAIIGDSLNIFSKPDIHPTIEGPKLYKRGGFYYVFAPAGGVKTGWQVVLRASDIRGPYEDRIVLHQGTTSVNGPHQGAWVDDRAGDSWFIHFQDKGAYGRIVHLQPMEWDDGWPVIGVDRDGDGVGEPVERFRKPATTGAQIAGGPQTSDDFGGTELGPQWQWQANPERSDQFYYIRDGYLVLSSAGANSSAPLSESPRLLLQKFPAPGFKATVKMNLDSLREGDRTGLVVLGADYQAIGVRLEHGQRVLEAGKGSIANGADPEQWTTQTVVKKFILYLRTTVADSAVCQFSFSLDGIDYQDIGTAFTAVAGRWVGARVGVYCTPSGPESGGAVSIDWFHIDP